MTPVTRSRWVASAASGLALVAAFPIHPVRLLAWVGLAPLLVALSGQPWRSRMALGWVAGAALFIGGLYWLVGTMHHFGGLPLALSILGHVLLGAFLALFVALFAVLAPALGLDRPWGIWGVAAAWVAVEYLRSFFLTGFPWLTLGYSQIGFLPMVQILDVTGVYGVSFLLAASGAAVAACWQAWSGSRPLPVAHLVALVLLVAGVRVYGLMRLREQPLPGAEVRIGLLQGNIPQDVKWDQEFQGRTIDIYSRLAAKAAQEPLDLLVLPETAMPFFYQRGGRWSDRANDLARANHLPVVFGAPAYRLKAGHEPDPATGRLSAEDVESLNRAYLLSAEGAELAHYDKMHLVPFGEWSPFPFLEKFVPGVGNFYPGREHVLFSLGATGRFGLLICYESIFPMEARGAVQAGAEYLLTITNDAWFGRLGAPRQHLEMGQARAIENRVWLARAANTGITAFIDPWGRVVQETDLFTEATLTGSLHRGPVLQSLYLRYGDVFARAASLVVLLAAAARGWLARRREPAAKGA